MCWQAQATSAGSLVQRHLAWTAWSTNDVISGSNARILSNYLTCTNVTLHYVICKTNMASICQSQCQIHPMAVECNFHDNVNCEIVIRRVKSVLDTSVLVRGIVVFTLLLYLSSLRYFDDSFHQVFRTSLIVHFFVYRVFRVGDKVVNYKVALNDASSHLLKKNSELSLHVLLGKCQNLPACLLPFPRWPSTRWHLALKV